MRKRHILFVDDEPFFADPYVRELEKYATVVLEETASGAIDAVNLNRPLDAIILDIVMPSPKGKEGTTADGIDIGLWVLGEILDTLVERSIPVVILTNRSIPRVVEYVELLQKERQIPVGLIVVRSKIETPRFLLPRIVNAAIQSFSPPPPSH